MPRIFDNIELPLLPALKDNLKAATRADFCVGYFNLRGWRLIDELIEQFSGGEGSCCRLLVGMQTLPKDELHAARSLGSGDKGIDQGEAVRLKKRIAEEFREQLMVGAPTNQDEEGLRRLSAQLKSKKLIVKLFLRHTLHAKLYLIHQPNAINSPIVGFLGSSNLTLSGLGKQGESTSPTSRRNKQLLSQPAIPSLSGFQQVADLKTILKKWTISTSVEE